MMTWDGGSEAAVLVRDTVLQLYGSTTGPAHGFAVVCARQNDDLYCAPMDSLASLRLPTPVASDAGYAQPDA